MTTSRVWTAGRAVAALLVGLTFAPSCGHDGVVATHAEAPVSPLDRLLAGGPYRARLRVTEDVGELTTSLVDIDYRGPESWTVSYSSEDATGQRDGMRFVREPGSWRWTQPSYDLSAVVPPEQQMQVDTAMGPDQWGPLVDQMIKDGRIPSVDRVLGSADALSSTERTVPGDFAVLSLFRLVDRESFWRDGTPAVDTTGSGYRLTGEGYDLRFDAGGRPVSSTATGPDVRRQDVEVLSFVRG